MGRHTRKTKTEAMQDIVRLYRESGGEWPIDKKSIASWAVQNGHYDEPRKSVVDRCAEELANAMRLEMETDPQGRSVRKNHCALIKELAENGERVQKRLWFDNESATPELMRLSLQQRRKAVFGDVKQLKTDMDSYNDNNIHGAKVQMSFNFENDLAELTESTEYNPC